MRSAAEGEHRTGEDSERSGSLIFPRLKVASAGVWVVSRRRYPHPEPLGGKSGVWGRAPRSLATTNGRRRPKAGVWRVLREAKPPKQGPVLRSEA